MKTHVKVTGYRDPTAGGGVTVDALGWVSRVEMRPFERGVDGGVGVGVVHVDYWRDATAAYDPAASPIGHAEFVTGVSGFPSLSVLMQNQTFLQGMALIQEAIAETVAAATPGAIAE